MITDYYYYAIFFLIFRLFALCEGLVVHELEKDSRCRCRLACTQVPAANKIQEFTFFFLIIYLVFLFKSRALLSIV